MSKRNSGGNGSGYEIGYGKPLKHTQFRPGVSGNSQGRPKGVHNLATDVKRTLSAPIKVKEGGRTKTRSTQEGALMVVRDKAFRGDVPAIKVLLDLALRFNSASQDTPGQVLSTDDQAILAAYAAEIVAATISANPPIDAKTEPKARNRSVKKAKK